MPESSLYRLFMRLDLVRGGIVSGAVAAMESIGLCQYGP